MMESADDGKRLRSSQYALLAVARTEASASDIADVNMSLAGDGETTCGQIRSKPKATARL